MLGSLIKTILLVVNAIAILNDKRFIKNVPCYGIVDLGSGTLQNSGTSPDSPTNPNQLVMLVLTLRTYGICKSVVKL
jgi:hypothetical protein